MVSVVLLTLTLEIRKDHPELFRSADIAILISAAATLGVGLTDWGTKGTLGALVLLLLAPVAIGIGVWLKRVPEQTSIEVG
jgi:hypothetical protein